MSYNILAIEDDPDIAKLLRINLPDSQYTLEHTDDGLDGYRKAIDGKQDLILLDVTLPRMDGFEICRKLRESGIQTPILMLTARSDEIDKVLGLEYGADDYLTKPFGIRELQARIKALLRRTDQSKLKTAKDNIPVTMHFDQLLIDNDKMKVEKSGQRLELTQKEFQLLSTLAEVPGKTWSRDQLLRRIWGLEFNGYEHTVNSHINRLRAKIEDDMNKPRYVLTTWGLGYRFSEDI